MFPYSLLIVLYAIFSFTRISMYSRGKERKKFLFLMLFPLFFITAFRDVTVGNDTIVYSYGFRNIAARYSLLQAINESRFETAYVIINYFISYIGGNYYLLQFFISMYIYKALYDFLRKRSHNIALSCFIFVTFRMITGPMNVVRMWLAIATLLYATNFLEKQKYTLFFILLFIAVLFHKSAFIFILLFVMVYLKKSINKYKVICFVSAIVIMLCGKMFFVRVTNLLGMYEGYLRGKYFVDINYTGVILQLLLDLLLLLFIEYNMKKYLNKKVRKPVSFVIPYLAIILVVSLDVIGFTTTMMPRFTGFFRVFYLTLIPYVLYSIKDKKRKYIYQVIIMIILVLTFYIVLYYRPQWYGVTPYKFYF